METLQDKISEARGKPVSEPTITQIHTNIGELRKLINSLGNTVDQQHQTLVTSRADLLRRQAAQSSDELARLLIQVRRNLEDLEKRIQKQQKEHEQLKALQEISAAVNSSLNLDQVLVVVMDSIISLTKAERAILLLKEDGSSDLKVRLARNVDQETIEKSSSFEISRTIVGEVAQTGEPVVTMNAQSDSRFSAQESIISYNLRSILCVPLKIKDQITGVIYTDNRIAAGVFGDTDRDLLASFANQAAVAIQNARLFEQIRAHLIEITEMRDLMDNVFASIASGVITIDEEDRIALYNRAAERILGFSEKAIMHETYQKALDTLGLPVTPLVEKVQQNGGAQNTELDVVVSKRPGLTTLNLTLTPLRDIQQEMLGVAMVLNDVTEKKRLESVRRYLPPALVDQIRDLDAAQRPQQRHMSVLFADVRGYSTFSEHVAPETLIQIMNGYFTEFVYAINEYQGLTDKFMGDAVMALYNTPLNPQDDHVERAVRTALMIRGRMQAYLDSQPAERRLHFGIGIHTGNAVAGNVGSDLRKDYSAIGDAVNLSKRIQENAQADEVLLSSAAYEVVKEWVFVEPLPLMQVKGRQNLEQIYRLLGEK
ncbi:MAG TPA: adenylate/guanylate cyclase domain-containing protein [Anaerolineae bacterium]|nr:adenylate/guanylate cyclase domain-containing protein [Anaerolineae bacterium]HIP74015.1 adenylate/guanylate cyclase domain-containing protein [Anaerolineae bacterium]